MTITLPTTADFDFRSAVCSFGFFVLAPNLWRPRHGELVTVITLSDERAVAIRLAAAVSGRISVRIDANLAINERPQVHSAVVRMLRLHEDLSPFHQMCRESATHQAAARSRFGRLIRSASLFEDLVKVICTCNVAWRQTVAMIDRIVGHWGVPCGLDNRKGFPTPARLAAVPVAKLKEIARVGYRAEFIHQMARDVCDGRLDLDYFERFDGSSDELHKRLKRIHGVGDYAASNLCMLLGRYDRLAIDTEMIRLLRQRHPRKRFTPAQIRDYYRRWRPFQFLAYWFELWQDYVRRHGRADQWSPQVIGRNITR